MAAAAGSGVVADGGRSFGWMAGGLMRLRCCAADDGDDRIDFDGGAFRDFDLGEQAGYRRWDLCVDFVGGDFEERFVFFNACRRLS